MPTKTHFTFRRDGMVEYDGVKIGRISVEYVKRLGYKTCYREYTGWSPTGAQLTTSHYRYRSDVANVLLWVYQARQRQWPVERLRETYGTTAQNKGE